MKKRVYFAISSIFAIIVSVITMINASDIVSGLIDSVKEVYSVFPDAFQERAINVITNAGPAIIIIMSLVNIFINIGFLYFVKNDTLVKNKDTVIGLSVGSLFTTNSFLVILLSIVNIIVVASAKRVRVSDYKEKKNKTEIPKLMRDAIDWDGIVAGVLLLLIYFSRFILSRVATFDFKVNIIITIAFNVIMIILCILVFYSTLKRDFKIFKDNIEAYIRFILPRLGIMYLIFIVANLIAILITNNGTSVNQEMLEALPKYYTIPAAIIFAPIVEELLFRGVFRKLIRNDKVFIVVSGVVFGLLHAISEVSVLNIVVMTIPYSLLGCFLAYMYVKTNNICTNITCHAAWNTIASIFMIFM